MTDAKPILYEGALAVDDRGTLSFVNSFDFSLFRGAGVKRFYLVENHKSGLVRAWHAHKREQKAVTVVSGAAIAAAVKIDNWQQPDPSAEIHRYVISASRPAVLFIPAGYANGFCTLTEDTKLLWLSSSTVEESKTDDYRFPARYWNPWKVEER